MDNSRQSSKELAKNTMANDELWWAYRFTPPKRMQCCRGKCQQHTITGKLFWQRD
jgi:hypothetical protein